MAVQRDNAIDHLVTRLASSAASAADGGRSAGRLMDPQKNLLGLLAFEGAQLYAQALIVVPFLSLFVLVFWS